jgi:hypothetical protein
MIPRPLHLAFALALASVTVAFAADTRFSQTLAISERAEIGFNRLSSDQVAALDALVRRDLAAQSAAQTSDPAPPARFSQRLTADERKVAGLTLLNEKELTRFDALVAQHASAALARVLLAPPVFVPRGMVQLPTEAKRAAEIHGSMTLSYGWGKGGYSNKTGAVELNYVDPVHNLAITFGYAESHIKGPVAPYWDDYSYRDSLINPSPFGP